jgi:hypothetical protein
MLHKECLGCNIFVGGDCDGLENSIELDCFYILAGGREKAILKEREELERLQEEKRLEEVGRLEAEKESACGVWECLVRELNKVPRPDEETLMLLHEKEKESGWEFISDYLDVVWNESRPF